MGEVLQAGGGVATHRCRALANRTGRGNFFSHHISTLSLQTAKNPSKKSTNGSYSNSPFPYQPMPQPRNRAPIDELENQPGIFERKDLLTQVLKYL